MRIVGPGEAEPGPLLRRLGWFVAIAAGSAIVVATIAYLLRALLLL